MTLGEKIKHERTKRNLTQDDLAKKIYVTRNAISKWETDRGVPNIESLKFLSKFFDVTIDYLINEDDLLEVVIENKRNIESNKGIIFSTLIFILYAFLNTVIPFFIFESYPAAGLTVYLLIIPLIQIVFGFFMMLFNLKWNYIVISTALALTPIYIFYSLFLPGIGIGAGQILYYVIFIIVYFTTSRITKKTNQIYSVIQLRKNFLILSIIFLLGYLITMLFQVISIINCTNCISLNTALTSTTIIFIFPIITLIVFTMYYSIRINAAKGDSTSSVENKKTKRQFLYVNFGSKKSVFDLIIVLSSIVLLMLGAIHDLTTRYSIYPPGLLVIMYLTSIVLVIYAILTESKVSFALLIGLFTLLSIPIFFGTTSVTYIHSGLLLASSYRVIRKYFNLK